MLAVMFLLVMVVPDGGLWRGHGRRVRTTGISVRRKVIFQGIQDLRQWYLAMGLGVLEYKNMCPALINPILALFPDVGPIRWARTYHVTAAVHELLATKHEPPIMPDMPSGTALHKIS